MKIKEGEKLPQAEFFYLNENNGVKTIDTKTLFANKKIILFGLPGAFTSTCSAKHLPGYVSHHESAKAKGVDQIICLSVNDPNVMKAWGEEHSVGNKIFMIGDPYCIFTKLIGAEIDRMTRGLGMRSSRYTMLIENGVATKIKEESDAGMCEISAAENFLKEI